ncbi:MAG: aminopeptidase N [Rhodothermales bacterium]|jgi:aminopeptidase N
MPAPDRGVPLSLAQDRKAGIHEVTYDLQLDVPESRAQAIVGTMTIGFDHRGSGPIVVDFVPETATRVTLNAEPVAFRHENEHLIIEGGGLLKAGNVLSVDFTAGDAPLNRNQEYLYALFVPDRARQALPVFDQPNLKARWSLTLQVPDGWAALSNGEATEIEETGAGKRYQFAQTEPIPTYLFTFVTGVFETISAERNGRTMTMYHRESDPEKVTRNAPEIFDLHASALGWLEDYTAHPYPFGKFDFVLIPSFQFGGMEHPGAIHYRASSLMLDEDVPQSRLLGRASLISHETAHMWFGDLVTMDWFNDVWTKEVFANFMAARIVEPSFPEVNHDLRFLNSHFPSAYAVDRTPGANPIRQDLDNLNDAGSLYGAIIYQKAPIVMRKLEALVGKDTFRDGMREYVSRFAFDNATWPDLIAILDALSELDLVAWSESWVEEAGMPDVRISVPDGRLALEEQDLRGRGLSWPQSHLVSYGGPSGDDASLVYGTRPEAGHALELTDVEAGAVIPPEARFILPNRAGLGYAAYHVPEPYLHGLLESVNRIPDPVDRGAGWITLWEAVLNQELEVAAFMQEAQAAVATESVQLIRDRVSGYLRSAYWRFLRPDDRLLRAAQLESLYLDAMDRAESARERYGFFKAWMDIVQTPEGVGQLRRFWSGQEDAGVNLSEWDKAELALELAVRGVANGDSILATQRDLIQDPDRQARFDALLDPLSSDSERRAEWFQNLRDLENRAHESRVLEGVRYMNHPLRAQESEKFIRPALDLVLEIQETGDIFFPKRWLDAVLGGHQTQSAAGAVEAFLDRLSPGYPDRLRGKVLQSVDGLKRAARISGS